LKNTEPKVPQLTNVIKKMLDIFMSIPGDLKKQKYPYFCWPYKTDETCTLVDWKRDLVKLDDWHHDPKLNYGHRNVLILDNIIIQNVERKFEQWPKLSEISKYTKSKLSEKNSKEFIEEIVNSLKNTNEEKNEKKLSTANQKFVNEHITCENVIEHFCSTLKKNATFRTRYVVLFWDEICEKWALPEFTEFQFDRAMDTMEKEQILIRSGACKYWYRWNPEGKRKPKARLEKVFQKFPNQGGK